MLSYKGLTKYFGCCLSDNDFQYFLSNTFNDLTAYNILESDYIVSSETAVELGFTNNDAVYDDDTETIFEKGNPVFSHFNIYPHSVVLINELPFDVDFSDTRSIVLGKAGIPTQTKKG